jgi:hypothetical protein
MGRWGLPGCNAKPTSLSSSSVCALTSALLYLKALFALLISPNEQAVGEKSFRLARRSGLPLPRCSRHRVRHPRLARPAAPRAPGPRRPRGRFARARPRAAPPGEVTPLPSRDFSDSELAGAWRHLHDPATLTAADVARLIDDVSESIDPSLLDEALRTGAVELADFTTPIEEPRFKAGVSSDPAQAGSIPVRLRWNLVRLPFGDRSARQQRMHAVGVSAILLPLRPERAPFQALRTQ